MKQQYAGLMAMENMETPTALIFSRQNIAKLPAGNDYEQARKEHMLLQVQMKTSM